MTQCSGILTAMGVWILLFAASSVSRADPIVFSNFDASDSYNTSGGWTIGASAADNFAHGDTFTPSANYDFTSLEVAIGCIACSGDTLDISLDANKGGVPGAALETFTISDLSLGPAGNNNPVLTFNSVGPPVLLTAGTQYWAVVTDPAGNDTVGWNQNDTGDTSAYAESFNGGAGWSAVPSGTATAGAYEVDGVTPQMSAVPEPGSVALLGTVVLLLLALWKPRALLRNR